MDAHLTKFNVTVAIRKGTTHVLANHMSRIPNGKAIIGVDDNLSDASLFLIYIVLGWADGICHYLANGLPIGIPLNKARVRRLILSVVLYQLIASQLYKTRKDGIVRRCVREDEFLTILGATHLNNLRI